jgi:hypothetical protein
MQLDILYNGLESYSRDWNGLDSDPPSRLAITLAKKLIDQCKAVDLKPTRVSASAEGGVALSFRNSGMFASLECLNSGEIVGLTSDGTGNPHAWEVGKQEQHLSAAVVSIREYLGTAADSDKHQLSLTA